ncbi:hypothetical protein HYV82_04715 [Candidatus Woesearchaeota archaeon]|nr:hypothetical protein [Candidatus Woesearchaeota archaeon]
MASAKELLLEKPGLGRAPYHDFHRLQELDQVVSAAIRSGRSGSEVPDLPSLPDLPDLMRSACADYIDPCLEYIERIMRRKISPEPMNSYERGIQALRMLQRIANKWGAHVPEERVAELQRMGVEILLSSAGKMVRLGRDAHKAVAWLNIAERYGPGVGVDVSAADGLRRQASESAMYRNINNAIYPLKRAQMYARMTGLPAAEEIAATAKDVISRLEELVRKQ